MDDSHEAWHRYHVDNKNDYADSYSDLMSYMGDWRRYDLRHRLVYFAMNFKPPRFVNKNVLAGFYDIPEPGITKVGVLFTSFVNSHPHPTIVIFAGQIPE